MDPDPNTIVSPADSRAVIGNLCERSLLCLKDKLFDSDELFGPGRQWSQVFAGGDCAIFRLTPDKYHYNHTPVSGTVVEQFGIDGAFHSCNPGAVVQLTTPFSKNRRFVTIIDTDLPGGSGVGKVAMIEVVALGIGDVIQCYSSFRYENPLPVEPGLFMKRGSPKSLFRPGSSTTVLLFEPGRVRFDEDLYQNQISCRPSSRLTIGFGVPLMETQLRVRSRIGQRVARAVFALASGGAATGPARQEGHVVA
jgi:phosphatidylserine decarboxylase